MLTQRDVLRGVHGQKDPTTLACGLRFHYENGAFRYLTFGDTLIEVLSKGSELVTFTWQEPGARVEIILVWQTFLHVIQGLSELILPCEYEHTRKVIGSLVWPQPQ